MPGFRIATKLAGIAVAGLIVSAPVSLAASPQHHQNQYPYSKAQSYYSDDDDGYGVGNQAAFPNTEDNSTKCVNGYRYIRHNYDWLKTTAETSLPVRCR